MYPDWYYPMTDLDSIAWNLIGFIQNHDCLHVT